jgi:LacI family transcriptional regulator
VLVNRFSDESHDAFVGSDDLVGGRLATEHLVELGHRRIGHLAGKPSVSTGVMRRRGYLVALADRGIAADPRLVVESGYTEEGGARAAERLLALPDRPTGIFAVTDMTAVGAFGVARRMGLRIPEDVAIVGYNDIPLATRMVPALTTVHVPIHDFGAVAARLLLEQIETGAPSRRRVVFNPELVVRGSTVAGGDHLATAQLTPAFATE